MCGASEKPMMMSGRAEFEVTAVCWLMCFPADEVDLDFNTGILGELGAIGAEHVFVGLHEAHRAQHAQGRALFDREFGGGDVGRLDGGLAEAPVGASAAAETPRANASRRVMLFVI
jgi:hypothetical protein